MTGALDGEEARVVESTWDAVGVPTGRRLQGVGCVTAFVGMATLTLTPAIGNYVDLGVDTAYGVLALAVALLVGGAALGLFGANRDRPTGPEPIEEAVEALVKARAARGGPALAEATVLLARMVDVGQAAPPGDWAERIGPALEDVRRVRAHLQETGRLAPDR
ncbi:MAG: hypothetical protein HKN71_12340 [Gemmatimonadetes bacterium]|nr:hypothetical protein [Gemmatimonadota bacterium]